LNAINSTHPRVDAAIVDLDGTLVDTLGDFVVALNLMLADLSLPAVNRATVLPLVGKGSEHLIKSVLALVDHAQSATQNIANGFAEDSTTARYDAAWRSYQRHYRAINGDFSSVYAGALEGLQQLQAAGLKLACLTNKPGAFARELLKRKALVGYFDRVFGGDAFERKKPDPLPVLKTCAALGTQPERTLMLGDSSNDARAARAAGCPVLLVTYGYNHGEPIRAVDADGWIDSLADWRQGLAPT
jgi:phosphoglycolate phosphatase